MNYSYKKFLSIAKPKLEKSFTEAQKIVESVSMSTSLDEMFPWTDGFKDALGRCGCFTDGVTFDISVHLRAIYRCLKEDFDDSPWIESEYEWERQISDAIDDTVFHEIGHGIFGTACGYYDEDDDFYEWCVSKGYDKTLFDDADEEELCEDYGRKREDSLLGQFIKGYSQWDGKR